MTNIDCLMEIMNFSRYGALAQAFVMDALSKHAAHIASMPLEELTEQFGDQPIVSAKAWHGVAQEIHEKLEAHFAR
ncbi:MULTISPECIES: hypothetical protein [Burkholderia cepacia complex]|uniref:Uncharacterized protein n=1 Tax=Burkholderia ubonensis TaxID=101571 RepID=A0A1R1J879_9BURK|nr:MULTISPECIES: hypothetical protein [Burkholderia cepacia complex]KVR67985.1 hypothetical protein WK24_13035 [Burkholderia vietnamiensis]MCA8452173.1 hypothetical protein [Burkholderia vietnamiensis]MDN7669652.1 hypothetical protein [Burkholderia vietnamiensis]OMG71476.1 hypothetical protein BW685_21025 [Burkholderia ubonensis]HDR8955852.1 hypothetical protein [Burkholderia vietnamiensis]